MAFLSFFTNFGWSKIGQDSSVLILLNLGPVISSSELKKYNLIVFDKNIFKNLLLLVTKVQKKQITGKKQKTKSILKHTTLVHKFNRLIKYY